MSTYVTLHKIQVQNANCIAGLTYGFPAITHFLGYIHELSRKLQLSHQLKLEGCAVICHKHQVHAYQPKGMGEYVLAQSRNPVLTKEQAMKLNSEGKTPPIMEEGKMHLTLSLVTHCTGMIGGSADVSALQAYLKNLCCTRKLAGGVINSLDNIFVDTCNSDADQQRLSQLMKRRLLPGFVLRNQSTCLREHFIDCQQNYPGATLIDAWMDFFTLKYRAVPKLKAEEELSNRTDADWKHVAKPQQGYLVPLMVGYKAISDEFPPGALMDVRDVEVPFNFVEAAYGIGEWVSPHRLQNIDDAMWFYQPKSGWFLCDHTEQSESDIEDDDNDWEFL